MKKKGLAKSMKEKANGEKMDNKKPRKVGGAKMAVMAKKKSY